MKVAHAPVGTGRTSVRQGQRLLLILAIPFLLTAQEAPKVVVQGRVLDSQTRQPLSGAAIRFGRTSEDSRTVESNAEGRFRFEGIEPGTYRASAFRSGSEPDSFAALVVRAGDGEHEMVIELDRYSVIAGRVLDQSGRPVVAAKVTAYQKELDRRSSAAYWYNQDMRGFAHSLYRGFTDDRGEYRMWGLPEGEFVVVAKPTPVPGPVWRLRFDAAPTFYPNSATFDGASRIALGWGEVREGIDIRLGKPVETVQTARVLANAEPCVRCGFAIFQKGSETDVNLAQGATSPQGEIVLEGFPPGEYIVGAGARARRGPRALGLRDFLIAPDGDRPFDLELNDPVTVRGRVIFEDPPEEIPVPPGSGAPFPQHNFARITHLVRDKEKLFYSCQSDTAEFYGAGAERFFEALASPGHCRIFVTGPPGSYIAGMSLEGQPLDKPEMTIPPSFQGVLTVRIRFDTGEVTGRVEDPDSDTWVHLLPANGDFFASRHSAQVAADGSFRAEAPPGRWAAVASRSQYRAVPSGDGPERIEVEVRAGETTTLASPLRVLE